MRLKSLIIQNFRNYKGSVVFDLSKDITILYGDNGNGKSSFFDALEWCISGDISRFMLQQKSDYKNIIANNNMSPFDKCSVSLAFDSYILNRSFTMNESGFFSNVTVSLLTDTGIKICSGEEKVVSEMGKIVSKNTQNYWDRKFLSKAYILSQNQVTDFIAKDSPTERYDALASIMGFEKVNNFKSNISKASEILQVTIDENISEYKELKSEKEKLELNLNTRTAALGIDIQDVFHPVDIENYSAQLSELKNKKTAIQSDEKKLKNLDFLDSYNLNELDCLADSLAEKMKSLNKQKQEHLTDVTKARIKLENIDQEYKELQSQSTILKQHNINQNDLNEHLHLLKISDLQYSNRLTSNIKATINETKTKLTQLDYCITHYDDYKSNQKKIEEHRSNIVNYNNKIQDINTQLENIDQNLNLLIKEFTDGQVATHIEKILNLVENTQTVVLNLPEYENTCPVCNSTVIKINHVLDHKIKFLIEETGKNKSIVESNIKQRRSLEKLQDERIQSKNSLDILIKQSEQIILKKTNDNTGIENHSLYKEILFRDNNLAECKNYRNQLAHNLREHKENLLTSEKIDKLRLSISKFEDKKIELNGTSIEEIQQQRSNELLLIEQLTKVIQITENEIDSLIDQSSQISNTIKQLTIFFEEYKVSNISILRDIFHKQIEIYNENEKSIENLINRAVQIADLKNLNNNIQTITKKLELLQENIKYFKDKKSVLTSKIQYINNEYGEKAESFLNNEHSPINQYYQYLNPNPSEFSDLYFEISNNNQLEIKINNNDKEAIANYVLSSGQLNVLAISIFIATNTAQTFSYFDFIAIDDPIQNMDDVNKFSITDVMSTLKQQLIFSTHSSEYVNLFVKKNTTNISQIAIYHLDSDNDSYKNILNY